MSFLRSFLIEGENMVYLVSKTIANDSYRVLEVSIDGNLTSLKKCVSFLNDQFIQGEFHLELRDRTLVAHLNLLDLNKFKKMVFQAIEEFSLEEENPFTELLMKIEAIGSYGIKSGKRSYVTYNQERKVRDRKKKVQNRGMFFYSTENNFSKDTNVFPPKFLDSIMLGDSEQGLKHLPDNCVDLVFTSPPYNFGLDYGEHRDGVNWNQYFDKLFRVFKECIRVTKYGGRVAINVQPLYSDFIPIHHIISDFFMKNRMIWRNEILWEKNNYNAKYTAWGSWKSPSNPYLKYTWEFIEVFSKGDLKHPGNSELADITDKEFKEWVNAKWSIAPERNMKQYGHPAMFPERLAERVIKLFSFQNDIVLDPFNGVGTTTGVARKLNRHFIGFDVSEEYVKIAKKRLTGMLDSF